MPTAQRPPPKSSATLRLKAFQAEDHLALRKHGYRALVANSPGTGKTILMLACIRYDRRKLTPAVVVAPASVVSNWEREAKKWLPGVRTHIIADMNTRFPRIPAEIYIISWSLLAHRLLELKRLRPRFLVGDEAHMVKSEEAQRSLAVRELAKITPHMVLMSGTPLINNVNELESIKGIFNQPNVPMIRRLLEDVAPEIPPKTRSTLPVTLRDEDAREYRKAEEDFGEWLERELKKCMTEGEAIVNAQRAMAAEALVKSGYLRRLLGVAKVPAAVDWIARAVRMGEPVVVFCEHQEVVEKLQRSLHVQRIGFVTIDGGTPREQRQDAIDSFQAGRVPVFIGTKAAKEGITLVRAKHLLFLERYWTSADEEQAEDRIRRIGQTRPTTIWFLHAVDTVDDRITQIITAKRQLIKQQIGAALIAEQDEDTALALIDQWGAKTTSVFAGQETDLGLGDGLPPIPPPALVCSLVFKADKYSAKAALAWATLHGYPVKRAGTASGGGVQLHIHDPNVFVAGKFKTVLISKEIKAVVGIRKDRSTRSARPPSRPVRRR